MKASQLTPVPPASRLPQRSGQESGGGGSEVVLQLNRSPAEAFSSLQQLQQQHWLNHRWAIQKNAPFKIETPLTKKRRIIAWCLVPGLALCLWSSRSTASIRISWPSSPS